jgi:parvulin-like peptidyl-prolyl isomerase
MTRTAGIAVVLAAGLAAAGCGSEKRAVPPDAVAIVGDRVVTKAEFTRALGQVNCGFRGPRGCPTRKDVMQSLVRRAQLEQKSVELGIEPSDRDVERAVESLKKHYFGRSEERHRRQLIQQGLTEQGVEADIRSQLTQERVYKEVAKNVRVDEADVEARYAKNKSRYVQPASRLLRHINVEERVVADSLYRRLKKRADFATLARRYAKEGPARTRGTRFRYFGEDRGSRFDRLAFSLETGEISKPFPLPDGWHIVQALGPVEGPKPIPLRDVRRWIREALLLERKQMAVTSWLERVRNEFAGRTWYQAGFIED